MGGVEVDAIASAHRLSGRQQHTCPMACSCPTTGISSFQHPVKFTAGRLDLSCTDLRRQYGERIDPTLPVIAPPREYVQLSAAGDEALDDEHYAMMRAQFIWRCEQAAAQPIDVRVDSTFILYIKDGEPKIVFQHEHEDFWQALRTGGVLPAQG
jgi:hypothetical protein